jgi:hypothetical protein
MSFTELAKSIGAIDSLRIPSDCKSMTEKYLKDKGGICGQSCLAVIENISIQEVLDNWKKLGIEFKGYSGWKQLREYLEKRGFLVKQMNINKFSFNCNNFYILRVQWLGEKENQEKPFYGWGFWTEASAHTHFIILHGGDIFCNETGIFDYTKLNNYLEENNGVLTSALEVRRNNGKYKK